MKKILLIMVLAMQTMFAQISIEESITLDDLLRNGLALI